MDCIGEVGLGARRGLCRRGLGLVRDVDCVDEGWAWREAWLVSARLGLARGVDCGGGMTVMRSYRSCVKRQCEKKVRKVANL